MLIVIENYYAGLARGYLQTFFKEEPFYFWGLDNMLLQIENVMDMVGYPCKSNEYRHMRKANTARQQKKELTDRTKRLREELVGFNPNQVCLVKKKCVFSIRIYSRRNASIQGILKNYRGNVGFRSGMDVIRVIHECLEEEVWGKDDL